MDGADYRPLHETRSFGLRLLTVVCAVISCLLTAGLPFGFSAIHSVLVDHGTFHETCDDSGASTNEVCETQALALTNVFTMATSALNLAGLPSGLLLDRLGPQAMACLSCFIVSVGCLIFASGSPSDDWCYYVGFVLIAIGGPSVFTSTVSFGNLLPSHRGLVTASCVGAFDASSVVFVVLAAIYAKGVSFGMLFAGYAVVPMLISLVVLALWPKVPLWEDDADDDEASSDVLAERPTQRLYSLDMLSLSAQFRSSEFWVFAYALSAFMLALNFFIATAPLQLEKIAPSSAEWLTTVFSLMLPGGGVVWVPAIGYVVDHMGLVKAWMVLWVAFMVFSLFSCLHETFQLDIFAYVAFTAFSFARPMLYTLTASFTAHMFGMDNFGTLYGCIFTLAGLVNTNVSFLKVFAQSYGYMAANRLLLGIQVAAVVLPALLIYQSRPRTKRRLSTSPAFKRMSSFDLRHAGTPPTSPEPAARRRNSSSIMGSPKKNQQDVVVID